MVKKISKIIIGVFIMTLIISFLTSFYYQKLSELLQLLSILMGLISIFCLSLWIALNSLVLNTFLNKFISRYTITIKDQEYLFLKKLNKTSQLRRIKFLRYLGILFSIILGVVILGFILVLIYSFRRGRVWF